MASFTDKPMQFNPYIQQLPVEEMVKVGMIKQDQYDKGVQKIQGQIDQVAGLDIYKDVDKAYLQSKLNQLGGNLTTVAAGDFSNFQLVNSVGGMVKQIGNDNVVQNAVSSTAWYRKQNAEMETKRKAGTSDIANEDLFQTQALKWMNDPNAGAKFNDTYIPFTDVFKKLVEIGKSVGVDSITVQQLFETDKDGNLTNKFNDVMAETLLKGKDKNKILQAFKLGMNSNDYKQLNITGRYNLKEKSIKDLQGILDEGFENFQKNSLLQKEIVQDKILQLKNNAGDQKIIDELEKQVIIIDDNINKRKTFTNEIKKNSDLDAIRGSIYTNNYLDVISNSLSEKESYTKYTKSPAVEILLDKEKIIIAKNTEARLADELRYRKIHDAAKMSQDRWAELFKAGLVDKDGNLTGAGVYSKTMREGSLLDKEGTYFTNLFEQKLTDDKSAIFSLYEKVAIADWQIKNSTKGFSDDVMRYQIKKQADNLGISYNDYIVLQGQKATERWNNPKTRTLGVEFTDDFTSINKLTKILNINKIEQDKEKDYIKDKAKDFVPIDLNKVDIKPITLSGIHSTTYMGWGFTNDPNDRLTSVTLDKRDVIDMATIIYHKVVGQTPSVFDSDIVKKEVEEAKDRQKKKWGMGRYINIYDKLESGEDWKPGEKIIDGGRRRNSELIKGIDMIGSLNYRKTRDLREMYYKEISQVGGPKIVPLYKDKPEQEKHLATEIASIVGEYSNIDDSYKDIVAEIYNKSQFQINITPAESRYGKNTYELQVTKENGNLITKPIMEKHYLNLTDKKEAPLLFINDIDKMINASNFNSTNMTYSYTDPTNAHNTAYVNDGETNTKNYNVAIDYVKGNGLYFPKLYVEQEDGWKLFSYDNPLGPQDVQNFASIVDDLLIKSIIKKKEDSKNK